MPRSRFFSMRRPRFAASAAISRTARALTRLESVLQELRERDRRDRTRAESPLLPAADAVIIDSTDLSLDEVVARVEAIISQLWLGSKQRETAGRFASG